ncbi:hypothetical protein TNCV_1020171 [Trichonephila clavipes]|nr:hypothetical protein TNCV_1020171 [Trichonephila clavipes]
MLAMKLVTQFERGRVIGLRDGRFSLHDIAERLPYPLCMGVWSSWQGMVMPLRRLGSGRPRGTTERED